MFKSNGKIICRSDGWMIIKVDNEIAKLYRNLLLSRNKSLKINIPQHDSHITIIYGKNEIK